MSDRDDTRDTRDNTREYGSMFDLILARGWQAIHSLLHATASAIHSSTRRDDDGVRLHRTRCRR